MPTILNMVDAVRLRLGDPRSQRPSDLHILNQVCSQLRTLFRHKRNSGNVWNYNELVITVVPNLATYAINAADFGTPLAVITYDPSNPAWIARLIPIMQPQNMAYNWSYPNNMAAAFIPYDGSTCTAQRCAFYWRDNVPYIEFLPVPLLAASYQVKYLQAVENTVNGMALSQEPLQSEDTDLAEIRAAQSLLGIAEWFAPDTAEHRTINAERRKDLFVTLSKDEALAQRQFEAAQLITTGPRVHDRYTGMMSE